MICVFVLSGTYAMHTIRCIFYKNLLILRFSKFQLTKRLMTTSDDIEVLRKPYHGEENTFLEKDLISKDPMKLFDNWLEYACSQPDIEEPNAMTLATVKENGRPAARMVLLKGYDDQGFKFFTNYRSSKAKELEKTPFAALVLHWVKLTRSIRIEGRVEKLSLKDADGYFAKRPRSSQIAAHVSSHQSFPVESRDVLKSRQAALEAQYKTMPTIPRPEHWGGFRLIPDLIEFWQGQKSRMHDRIVFRKKDNCSNMVFLHEGENGWVYQRLEP